MSTPDEVSTPQLDALLRERTGLDAARHHGAYRQHLIDMAMARHGVRDEEAFVALLRDDARAFDDLISDLTIPESYFFRDAASYELLRREVLPALRRVRPRDHVLEVWSAGCAGGEEAYSLAILLEQEGLAERGRVLGTDVSRRALARASEGVYARWSLRASSQTEINRYFQQDGNKFRLTPRIRERVRFQKHSLSATSYPRPFGGFDLVLCRNVLIYFGAEAIAATGQRLAQTLAVHGYLLLGPSDPLLAIEEWCEVIPTGFGMLYRRLGSGIVRPKPKPSAPLMGAPEPARLPARVHISASAPSGLSVAPPPPGARPIGRTPARTRTSRPPAAPSAPHARIAADIASLHLLASEHGPRAAETGCRDLLAEHPLSAELHFVHASLLLDLGRHEPAEEALRRALYLDRTLLPAQFLTATLAERRGDRATARRHYESVAEQCQKAPDDAPVPLGDGLTYGMLAALATQRAEVLLQASNQADHTPRASNPRGES